MLCPDQKIRKKIATALIINFCPLKVPLFTPLYPKVCNLARKFELFFSDIVDACMTTLVFVFDYC